MKNHFHSVNSKNMPINNAPIPAPTGGDAAKIANVKLRAVPGGTVVVRNATALGMRIPPPIPDMARITTKLTYVVQKAFASEKTKRMQPPSMSMFWCPYMVPMRPLMSTKELCVRLMMRQFIVDGNGWGLVVRYEYAAAIQFACPGLVLCPSFLLNSYPPARVENMEMNCELAY